jgi:hypothetical protein
MKAKGQREARRPWFIQYASFRPEGPKYLRRITPFQGWVHFDCVPGATRFALAPGFHISRLWRCTTSL